MKPTLVFDLEVFADYFLCQFMDVATEEAQAFDLFQGQKFDITAVNKVLKDSTLVGFNSAEFDLPLLSMALAGATTAKIKQACDAMILNNLRSWQLERKFNFKTVTGLDHIDLIEVAPGMVSLKAYGGRMHSPKLQDLPFVPDSAISVADRVALRSYCKNDLDITAALYRTLLPQITLRIQMGKQYGLELRSKSDAQIAETVIKREVEKLTGNPVERPEIDAGTEFRYTAPSYVTFRDPALKRLLVDIQRDTFVVQDSGKVNEPPWLKTMSVKLGESTYKLGVGGIHSTESSVAHHADTDTVLVDRDVFSYYPSLILANGSYPKHIGESFLIIYKTFYKTRGYAKRRVAEIKDRIAAIEKELSREN